MTCIHPDDDIYTQVAHTVYGEGGVGSSQAAANIMQIILNRAYVDWTCWETGCSHSYINGSSQIPWEDITQEQLVKMMLFVLSEPYGEEAAFNAWTEPEPHYSTGTTYWTDVNNAVVDLIESPVVVPWESDISVGGVPPADPIRDNPNVQYYVSYPPGGGSPTEETVAQDALPGGRIQYYGQYPMDDD